MAVRRSFIACIILCTLSLSVPTQAACPTIHLEQGISEWEYTMCRELNKQTFSSDDIRLIQAIVMAEAETECYEGKLAVAQIILYRARKNETSIYNVIYSPAQFSVVGTKRMKIPPDEDCILAVDEALFGSYVLDPEIEYFCSGYSSWHENALINVGTIGGHHFYKEKH